jgi:hypothetical protein
MGWVSGIITGLLVAILLTLTGNRWACGWIFGAGIVYAVFVVLKSVWDDGRERRAAKLAAQKPVDFRSFMGMN